VEDLIRGAVFIVIVVVATIFVILPKLYKAVRTGEIVTRKATYRYADQKGAFITLFALLTVGSLLVLSLIAYLVFFFTH
jgi:hypothetical protein